MGIKILVCILSLPGLILGHTHPLGKRVVCFSTVLANWYPDEAQIFDFPIIAQMPELPTGCEITALTMLLHAKGYDVDKYEMAMTYLPRVPYRLYTGDDGRLYGPDLNAYFVGNPSSEAGYVCGVTAIIRAGEQYLAAQNSALTVVDLTGASPEDLYRRVSHQQPVMVWVTIGMNPRYPTEGWYTESGQYVEWSRNDHGAVLVGYNEDSVWIADPLAGLVTYDRADFEAVYASRGSQAVVLE